MLKLVIEAKNAADLREQIRALGAEYGVKWTAEGRPPHPLHVLPPPNPVEEAAQVMVVNVPDQKTAEDVAQSARSAVSDRTYPEDVVQQADLALVILRIYEANPRVTMKDIYAALRMRAETQKTIRELRGKLIDDGFLATKGTKAPTYVTALGEDFLRDPRIIGLIQNDRSLTAEPVGLPDVPAVEDVPEPETPAEEDAPEPETSVEEPVAEESLPTEPQTQDVTDLFADDPQPTAPPPKQVDVNTVVAAVKKYLGGAADKTAATQKVKALLQAIGAPSVAALGDKERGIFLQQIEALAA